MYIATEPYVAFYLLFLLKHELEKSSLCKYFERGESYGQGGMIGEVIVIRPDPCFYLRWK